MRIDLVTLAKRAGYRRKRTVLRTIRPPSTLSSELARILSDAGPRIWEAALPAINAAYAQALTELQTDAARDVRFEIDATGVRAANIFTEITTRIVRWVSRVEQWHRDKWTALISPTGVDLSTMIHSGDVSETLETVVARNVALIKDVSAQAQARISDAVFRGLQKRSPARDVARELREAVDMSRARSIRIASDQLQKLTSTLDRERMEQVGIEKYQWQHGGALNPREEHLDRDGNVYDLGEPEDEPGELINCSCKRAPILSIDD